MPIRLVLVSGSAVLRTGLRQIISGLDEIAFVEDVGEGNLRAVAAAAVPDVILIQARPSGNGIDIISTEVAALGTERPAVVLMIGAEPMDEIWPAVRVGIDGYVQEVDRPEDIIAAIRSVASGDAWLSPPIARRFLDYCRDNVVERSESAASVPLTPRERGVIEFIALGLSNAEVAAELRLSESTVKTHVSRMLHKLGLRDRTQLARFAYENQLIPARRGLVSHRAETPE